jgi:hypothetical protein
MNNTINGLVLVVENSTEKDPYNSPSPTFLFKINKL